MEIDWVEIPAGEFVLGLSASQAEGLLGRIEGSKARAEVEFLRGVLSRETYGQAVWLETFYISRFPITWKQYAEFAQSDHHYSERYWDLDELEELKRWAEERADLPADTPWHFALAFCDWIGARLSTSAEWEKAARGTDGRLYPWGNAWDPSRGNFTRDEERWPDKTSPVTAYPSGQSPYGVMDMLGNTYEWTLSTMFGPSGSGNPAELVVCRSCSCDFYPTEYPDWFRNRVTSIMGNDMYFGGAELVGFRPVLDEWHQEFWSHFSESQEEAPRIAVNRPWH